MGGGGVYAWEGEGFTYGRGGVYVWEGEGLHLGGEGFTYIWEGEGGVWEETLIAMDVPVHTSPPIPPSIRIEYVRD
jgi:hypothetical protein